MNRNRITQALNRIDHRYLEECAQYSPPVTRRPSERMFSMGRYETKPSRRFFSRKTAVAALAACLILALGVTAYATGAAQSLLAKWANAQQYRDPEEVRESNPEYAQWIEQQLEVQESLRQKGEQAQQVDLSETIAKLGNSTVTLKEYYYDGSTLSAAGVFQSGILPASFDFDENHPMFSELEDTFDFSAEAENEEFWKSMLPLEDDISEAKARLKQDGHVGFTVYKFNLTDHARCNGEDIGFPVYNLGDGTFYIDRDIVGFNDVELPEGCRNQSSVTLTMNIRCIAYYYYLEGTMQRSATEFVDDYQVDFVLNNTENS